MKTKIEIMKDVPIPPKRLRGRPPGSKYPFDRLEVGESFYIASTKVKPASMASITSRQNKMLVPKKFTTRTTAKGITVWRVE